MAVKIRLKRMGAKKQPFYRIVVADARAARDGRYVEAVGYYDPLRDPAEIRVDQERALDWLRKGAQLSEAVKDLFRRAGVWDRWVSERASRKSARATAEPVPPEGPAPHSDEQGGTVT